MSALECFLTEAAQHRPSTKRAAGASQQKTVGCLLDVVVAAEAQPLLTLPSIAGTPERPNLLKPGKPRAT